MCALRVGIIGVGWGSVVQTPAFRAVPEYEVAALCSRRADSVAAAGERLAIADVSTDWEAFVQRDDLDIVSICTPVDLHREQTLAAIDAGKHVLVEKPVGLDSAETGAMLAAAEAAGVAHAVCFEGRWEPARYQYWQMVQDGHLGQAYLASARSGGDFWHPSRGLQSEWMYQVDRGGGYLMGMGSHDIDYACALFGEPEAVCADLRTSVPERPRDDGTTLHVDADDTSALLLRMRDGALVTITTTAVALQSNFRAFESYGSDGSLTMAGGLMGPEADMDIVAASVDAEQARITPTSRELRSGAELPERRATPAIRALALMLEDWLPAFDSQPTVVPTLVDGDRVARVIDAARASAGGAGWVSL